MSYNQYSPLDTTLPFFSNHLTVPSITYNTGQAYEVIIPFLLEFKAIAKRIKITNRTNRGLQIYLNNDRENHLALIKTAQPATHNKTFNQW